MYKYSNSIYFGGFKERSKLEENDFIIINLSKRNIKNTDYWIPLNDGVYDNGGNTQQKFAEAVNTIRENMCDNKIFVHCAVGQSRSVSALATAIAAEKDKEFKNILNELLDIRGCSSEPNYSLQNKAKVYLRHI